MIWIILAVNAVLLAGLCMKRKESGCWNDAIDAFLLKTIPRGIQYDPVKLPILLGALYGERNNGEQAEKEKLRNARTCFVIWIFFSFCSFGAHISGQMDHTLPSSIERPDYGSGNRTIRAEVEIVDDEVASSKDVELLIREKQLSEAEKLRIMDRYADKLPDLILGRNEDAEHVFHELWLPESDKETGIGIKWHSSHPDIVQEDGTVDSIDADDNQRVELMAELELEGVQTQTKIGLKVVKPQGTGQYQKLMQGRIDELVENVNKSNGSGNVELPVTGRGGFEIKWRLSRKNWDLANVSALLTAFALVYINRHRKMEKAARKKKMSMERDFPDFICKFVMLLNAGLVVSSAIGKIAEDQAAFELGRSRPLYEEMAAISCKVRNSNASLAYELRSFAERSGIQEIMRFALIVGENLNKGSRLEEKLEAEGALLWHKHKKRAEELGRTADTKLTLPLMILLMSLILITISPAMISI